MRDHPGMIVMTVGRGERDQSQQTFVLRLGKTLKKEDLEKLGLTDTKTYEALKKELENVAKGEKWKLDVVDTPRGREYRGIYGKDVEEDESGDEKKKTEGTASPENEEKNPEGDNEGDGEQGSEEERETAHRAPGQVAARTALIIPRRAAFPAAPCGERRAGTRNDCDQRPLAPDTKTPAPTSNRGGRF